MWKDKQDGRRSDEVDSESNGPSLESMRHEPGQDVSAFVGKGVVFKGNITYNGTVRIDGTLEEKSTPTASSWLAKKLSLRQKSRPAPSSVKGRLQGIFMPKTK